MSLEPDPYRLERLYEPYETVVDSWLQFQSVVNDISFRFNQNELVWRGARRAEWGISSSLDRVLRKVLGHPPNESEMVDAEREVLRLARREWRFDNIPAMELMAHLQHIGAPTRLLDVTANPLIALWFAVEDSDEDNVADGRVFAFTLNRPDIHYHELWSARHPRWHSFKSEGERRSYGWGTGRTRRVWRPPAFNPRIAAQNSAFLVDGIPSEVTKSASSLSSHFDLETLRDLSSFNLRLSRIERDSLRSTSVPAFTIRVSSGAKRVIRDQIERRYGYSAASIYADLSGLAQYIATNPAKLFGSRP